MLGPMLRISADAYAYACQSSGHCCKGWEVGVDRKTAGELPKRIRGIARYEGKRLFLEKDKASTLHFQVLDFSKGQCVFVNPDLKCDVHARFGPEAKPLICRQYPFLAVKTPPGTDIHLAYSCPSAILRLKDPGPFRILQDPPDPPLMAYVKEIPASYPIGIPWEEQRLAEDQVLALLASGEGEPSRELAFARMALERMKEGKTAAQAFGSFPGPLPLPSGADARKLAGEALRVMNVEAPSSDPVPFSAEDWRVYRRYLSAKCFGNLLWTTYGLVPAFQAILLLGYLVRVEAGRKGGLAEAIEWVERRYPHESGVFDFWGRKGKGLGATAPVVSGALIVAGLSS